MQIQQFPDSFPPACKPVFRCRIFGLSAGIFPFLRAASPYSAMAVRVRRTVFRPLLILPEILPFFPFPASGIRPAKFVILLKRLRRIRAAAVHLSEIRRQRDDNAPSHTFTVMKGVVMI